MSDRRDRFEDEPGVGSGDGTDLVRAGSSDLEEGPTRQFVEAVLGSDIDANEVVPYLKRQSQLKTVQRAGASIRKRNLVARSVSLKLLLPLLEGAALEDDADDEMIDRWAALLANSAVDDAQVLLTFPRILRELLPVEAKALDRIYAPKNNDHPSAISHFELDERFAGLGLTFDGRELILANLERAGLIRITTRENLLWPDTPPDSEPAYVTRAHIIERTTLGAAFVRACQGV